MWVTDNKQRDIKRKTAFLRENTRHLQTGQSWSWRSISPLRLYGHWLWDCWISTTQPAGRDRWAGAAGAHRQHRVYLCCWGQLIPDGWLDRGQWIMSDAKPLGKRTGAFFMVCVAVWLREWLLGAGQSNRNKQVCSNSRRQRMIKLLKQHFKLCWSIFGFYVCLLQSVIVFFLFLRSVSDKLFSKNKQRVAFHLSWHTHRRQLLILYLYLYI